MAKVSKGGFKARSMRQRKEDLRLKTENRKRNIAGCNSGKGR
jgi:hypothetical protein